VQEISIGFEATGLIKTCSWN